MGRRKYKKKHKRTGRGQQSLALETVGARRYTPAEVLDHIEDEDREYDGWLVNMFSLRYRTFAKGLTCAACGREATFFLLQRFNQDTNPPNRAHFNLYAQEESGNLIPFTKDHIKPKAEGGKDDIDNLQTMCGPCNGEKRNDEDYFSEKNIVHTSKFLSLVLRHKPEVAGVTLDEHGWVPVDLLLKGAKDKAQKIIGRRLLDHVVANNNKKRFQLSSDGYWIRARQGHSVDVDLGYQPMEPPDELYHGTAYKYLGSIGKVGLNKGKRHAVHMSSDQETAINVGSRHGKPVVLVIKALDMHKAGHTFYLTGNGVWLVHHVLPKFILFP